MIPLQEFLRLLDPQAFEVESITYAMGVQVIPIDGKTVRQSFDRDRQQKAIHVVSAQVLYT